jgi:hypothetical protein
MEKTTGRFEVEDFAKLVVVLVHRLACNPVMVTSLCSK